MIILVALSFVAGTYMSFFILRSDIETVNESINSFQDNLNTFAYSADKKSYN